MVSNTVVSFSNYFTRNHNNSEVCMKLYELQKALVILGVAATVCSFPSGHHGKHIDYYVSCIFLLNRPSPLVSVN